MLPVIGIPTWKWKKELRLYAFKKPNIIKIEISSDLFYETSRHFEILNMFDTKDTSYYMTEYYNFYKKRGYPDIYIINRINRFKDLYLSVIDNGCLKCPIVTDDGCRLDGSHRLSILVHLKAYYININIACCELVFDKRRSKRIRNQVIKYKKKKYGLY